MGRSSQTNHRGQGVRKSKSADAELALYLENDRVTLLNPQDEAMLSPVEAIRKSRSASKAHNSGRRWEDSIRRDLARIQDDPELRDKIVMIKTDPPTRTVFIKGRPTIIYEKEGPPDWMGVAFGFPVALETKNVGKGGRFGITLPSARSKGNLHQFEHLHRIALAAPKAIVGYYIHWEEFDERRFHPLSAFTPTLKTGRVNGFVVADLIDLLSRFSAK